MSRTPNSGINDGARDLVDEALADWRSRNHSDAELSNETREKILRASRSGTMRSSRGKTLFVPWGRLALAGALPLLLLGLFVGSLSLPWQQQEAAQDESGTLLLASKEGSKVIFTVINGDTSHRILRSTDPSNFGSDAAQTGPDGVYEEGLSSGADIVFYRVD